MTENLTKTTSTTSTKAKSTTTADTKTKREHELEEQLSSMMDIISKLQARLDAVSAPSVAPTVVVSAPTTDVTLVYLSDSLGVIQTNNTTLNCTRFGEEFTLPRNEFDAIVGKYRHWFDEGILAVSSNDIEVAAKKLIKTDKEYAISADKLEKIGRMSTDELEALWNSSDLESHKLSIVTFYKRKFIEGEDKNYQDRAKVDLMNRLTNGGFEREAAELAGGSSLKIRPTELI